MSVSKEEVRHLGELARVYLSPAEVEALAQDLSSIVDFVASLKTAATKDIAPMTGGTREVNCLRPDAADVGPLGDPEDLRSAFVKEDERGNLIVPKIFDRAN
jgi:aspartyl/glutamyl-tRNA(Asn/Gln) amidotransferase C subunit